MSIAALSALAVAAAVARATTVEAATLALLTALGSWRLDRETRSGIGGRGIMPLVGWINLASASVALLAIHLRRKRGLRRTGEVAEESTVTTGSDDGAATFGENGGGGRRGGVDGDGIALGSMLVPLFVAAAAAASSSSTAVADGVLSGSCDAVADANVNVSGGDGLCVDGAYLREGGVGCPPESEWYALASSLAGLHFATSTLLSCIVPVKEASVVASTWRKVVNVRLSSSSLEPEALFYAAALVVAQLVLNLGGENEGCPSSRWCWSVPCLVLAFKCASTTLFHSRDVSVGGGARAGGGNDQRNTDSDGHRVAASKVNSPPSASTNGAVLRNGASSNGSGGGPGKDHGDGTAATNPHDEGNGHVWTATRAEEPGDSSLESTPGTTGETSRTRRRGPLPVTPGEFAAVSTLASVLLADYVVRYLIPQSWSSTAFAGGHGLVPMRAHLAAAHGGLVGCLLGCAASELVARTFVGRALRIVGYLRRKISQPPRDNGITVANGVGGDDLDGGRCTRVRGKGRGSAVFVEFTVRSIVLASVAFACVDQALRRCIVMRWWRSHPSSNVSSPWPTTSSSSLVPGALSLRWIGAFLSTPDWSDELEAMMGIVATPVEVFGDGGENFDVAVVGDHGDPIADAAAADRCSGSDGSDGVVAAIGTKLSRLATEGPPAEGIGAWWSGATMGGGGSGAKVMARGSWLSYWAAVLLAAAPFAAWLAVRQLRRRRRRSSSVVMDRRGAGTVDDGGGDASQTSSSSGSILVPSSHRGEVVVARKYFHLVAVALFAPATASAPSVMALSYAVALALLIVVESLRLAAMMGGRVTVEEGVAGKDVDSKRRDCGDGAGETTSAAGAGAGAVNGNLSVGNDGNTQSTQDGMDSNGAHASNGSSYYASKDHSSNGAVSGSNGHTKNEKNDRNGHDQDVRHNDWNSAADDTTAGDVETETMHLASLNDFYVAFLDDKDAPGGEHGGVVVTHAALIVGCALPLWTALALFGDDTASSSSFRGMSPPLLQALLPYVGIIVLGVGDAFGAVLGTYLGRHRWPGTRRTMEGSLAMFLSMVAFTAVLVGQTTPGVLDRGGRPVAHTDTGWDEWCRALAVMVVLTVLEASTSQIDNFCLPLAGTALVLILGNDGLG